MRCTYSQMTEFTAKVDYAGIGRLVGTWIRETKETKLGVDTDVASLLSFESLRPFADDTVAKRATAARKALWTFPDDDIEISPSVTVGAIVTSSDTMELLATAGEIERNGVSRDSTKARKDIDETSSPTTSRHIADAGTSHEFEHATTEELTPTCARKYAEGAMKLPQVKEYLRRTGEAVYLVVGTITLSGAPTRNVDPRTGLWGRPTPSGSSNMRQDSYFAPEEKIRVRGVQLRPVRAASRGAPSRGRGLTPRR